MFFTHATNIHSLAWMIILILDNNPLTGPIPSELGLLTKLTIPSDPPTALQGGPLVPTAFPTIGGRLSIMQNVIGSSFEDDFPSSELQESVLNWLANTDPANLALDTDPATLLERYTAALFYFATQAYFGTDQTGWLSENPVCSWSGLDCTDQGFLASMDLGTCLLVKQVSLLVIPVILLV
jgi:hypothetical protein